MSPERKTLFQEALEYWLVTAHRATEGKYARLGITDLPPFIEADLLKEKARYDNSIHPDFPGHAACFLYDNLQTHGPAAVTNLDLVLRPLTLAALIGAGIETLPQLEHALASGRLRRLENADEVGDYLTLYRQQTQAFLAQAVEREVVTAGIEPAAFRM